MARPRFSLRALFAATAAVGALLASITVENDIATVVYALLVADAHKAQAPPDETD